MSNETYEGTERRQGAQFEQFLVVKSWQVLITVIVLFASILLSWATFRDQTVQNAQDIQEIKSRPTVSKEELQSIDRRLERIENKLDAQDVRDFQREFNKKSHP